MKGTIYLESLGCVRNLVDSEAMLGCLAGAGWTAVREPGEADVIVVNTCGFIESASDESVDTILEMAEFRKTGLCGKLIVAGCLPERYREKIADALPEVDVFLGAGAFDQIVGAAEGTLGATCVMPDPDSLDISFHDSPRIRDISHMAYVKIAEGCDSRCTYCIIPKLRGKQKSRKPDVIVAEARGLIESGARELILVAQDTTNYGKDLGSANGLADLLDRLASLSDETWIRFLYGHPESIGNDVIETVAARENICPYFDLPIQHASDSILRKMGRRMRRNDLLGLFKRIRETVPGASLRTTVMTGFPGETGDDFETLLRFVEEVGFDHLGAFAYSDSDDLPSHRLPDHVPEETARERYDRVMSLQIEISSENNGKRIGGVVKTLVEEKNEDGLYCGRTAFQAPEVDGLTYIRAENLEPGSFADVKITDALEYDLIGEIA